MLELSIRSLLLALVTALYSVEADTVSGSVCYKVINLLLFCKVRLPSTVAKCN